MSTLDVTLETVVCNNNVEEGCMSMMNLKSVIQGENPTMLQKTICNNYELPYTEYGQKKLAPLGFTVHHQGSNKPLVAANEYVFSKCDLLVYHSGKCEVMITQ